MVLDDREQVEKTAQALVQVQESAGTVICLERESRFLYGHEARPGNELVLLVCTIVENFLRGVIYGIGDTRSLDCGPCNMGAFKHRGLFRDPDKR